MIDMRCDLRSAIVTFASQPQPFILESACDTAGYGRYTILGHSPIAQVCAPTPSRPARSGEPFRALRRAFGGQPQIPPQRLPFAAGWVGWIPYEAGAAREGVHRPRGRAILETRFALYDAVVVFDHATGEWYACAVDLPGSRGPASQRVEALRRLVTQSEPRDDHPVAPVPDTALPQPNMTRDAYLDAVARAIRHIEAGDIYQVNLTQRFTAATTMSPLDLYLRLRDVNRADFAAFLPWGDRAIVSASPELFLRVEGRRVITRPIKGTRPRGRTAAEDASLAAELQASDKDRAELNMIVDLLRNDLGRVCEYGSVRVLSDGEIESHPTVFHRVATIEGTLRGGSSPVDLLAATFPGGSITGCPKIRAMQIARELEPTPRDVYCGSIGYVGLDGAMTMNIAIRTMVHERGRVHLYAGGAITADSDPNAEYREILAKAEGMFQALGRSTAELEPAATCSLPR